MKIQREREYDPDGDRYYIIEGIWVSAEWDPDGVCDLYRADAGLLVYRDYPAYWVGGRGPDTWETKTNHVPTINPALVGRE
jgi:hypothetical protein